MNTFKLTMPNGIIIESTWSNEVAPKLELPKAAKQEVASTPKVKAAKAVAANPAHQPKAVVEQFSGEATCKRCIAGYEFCSKHNPKPKASKPAAKPSKKATPAKTPKVSDSKALLAAIRQLKAEGKFSEAVALTPPAWTQVIGELQRAAERQGTTYNAAVSSKKSAKRVASKKRKAAKQPAAKVEAPTAPKEQEPVGALDMPADTGSAKPTTLAPKVEAAVAAKASLRDHLTDIGVADFVIDVLTGDISLKTTRQMYTTATEDEVLDLMEACRQEALLIEDAAERMEAAGLKVDVVNGLVELWKAFAAKLSKTADAMTAAV